MFISIWSCSGLCSIVSVLVLACNIWSSACLCLEVSGLVLVCIQSYNKV